MLPTVDFCGLTVTRLIIGANPFGGYSHQTKERDAAMVAYHTPERIMETWNRAEAAGINTMITNNTSANVLQAVRSYLPKGKLQWIVQASKLGGMNEAVDQAVALGGKALYFHGGLVDELFTHKDDKTLRAWVQYTRSRGLIPGVAAHDPKAHYWVDSLKVVDFHVVCFFNCGSLHSGQGHKFRLADVAPAAQCIRRLKKPCIGYKIMGAGRIDPAMAFEYAFDNLKAGDIVNVGMHRGDKDGMVEENVGIVRSLLAR